MKEILLEEDEFLSDKLLNENLQCSFIWAPTGTGKTTLFAKIAEKSKKEGKSSLFITSSNAIQDAFTEKLHCEFNQINAQTQSKLQFANSEIAVINLQHFEAIRDEKNRKKYLERIYEHFDNIFVDEFHLIFYKQAYLDVARTVANKATFCTGTKIVKMNEFIGENNITPYVVMKPGSSHIKVKKCYTSGNISAIDIIHSIKLDKPTLVQVRTVKEALMTSGWLYDNKIEHDLCIARDRVPNITTASEAINDLRNKKVKVIVATKGIMGEAVDIKNIENAICVNTTDFLEDSVQLVGRFRDAKNVELYSRWDDNRWSEQYFVENVVKSHSFEISNHKFEHIELKSYPLVRKAYENNSILAEHYRNIITHLLVNDKDAMREWTINRCFLDVTDVTDENIESLLTMLEDGTLEKINNRKWKIDPNLIRCKEIDGVTVCSSDEETEIICRRELLKKFFRIEHDTYLIAKWYDYSDELKRNNSCKYHYVNKWLNIDLTVTGSELEFKTQLGKTLVEIKEDCLNSCHTTAQVKTQVLKRVNSILESMKKHKFQYRHYKVID